MAYEYEFKQPDGTYTKKSVDTNMENTAGYLSGSIRKPTIPTGSNTPEALRYPSITGNTNKDSAYETESAKYYANLNKEAPDQGKIYSDSLAIYQQEIDSINNLYNQLVSQENVAGRDRLGQTRAIGSAVGIGDSPRGMAQLDKTEKANAKVVEGIRQEQNVLVSQVLTKARERADDKIKTETELARTNAKDYLTYLKTQQDDARTDALSLAKANVPLSQLSDEDYKTMLENTGYDPLLFESLYNSNMPKNKAVSYDYKQFGDMVVRVGDDGTFKEIGNYPELADKQIDQLSDGTLVVFDPNTGNYVSYDKFKEPPEVQGSAGSGYFYVDYDANGKPTMKWLTRGTDGDGSGSDKIIDYVEAIDKINSMKTITDEEAKTPMSIEGMTKSAKESAIKNIKAQAADDLKSGDYDKVVKISVGNDLDRTYGYKTILNQETGQAGIWDEDAGRFLNPTEQASYVKLKQEQSISF